MKCVYSYQILPSFQVSFASSFEKVNHPGSDINDPASRVDFDFKHAESF